MAHRLRKKEILIDSFGYTVHVYYQKAANVEEMAKKIGKKNATVKKSMEGSWKVIPAALVLYDDKEGYESFMFISDDVTNDIICHEVIHVITDLFNKTNTIHNEHTDELYAYLSQFLFQELVKHIIQVLKVPTKSFLNL